MSKRRMIDLNLNLTELAKGKAYYKQGKKGLYVDLRLIEMDNKQYNDMMCVVKVPKEEYDQGKKGDIVGYAKDWDLHNSQQEGGSSTNAGSDSKVAIDDLPF